MSKVSGIVPDGNPTHNVPPPRIEAKRPHQCFVNPAEAEFFPNKKQAAQRPCNQPIPGHSHSNNVPQWDSSTSFQTAPSQFNNRSFGFEAERSVSYANQVVSTDARKGMEEQYASDISVGLTMSHSTEDIETCFNYGGIRKVKVNHVKDSGIQMGGSFHGGNPINVPYNRRIENIPVGYGDQSQIRALDSGYEKGDGNVIDKGESSVMSFGGFSDVEADIVCFTPPVLDNLDKLCTQSSPQVTEADEQGKLEGASGVGAAELTKARVESLPKEKIDKPTRREALNSFPSNVRSLMATGILDGVPVKYVAVSREVKLLRFV